MLAFIFHVWSFPLYVSWARVLIFEINIPVVHELVPFDVWLWTPTASIAKVGGGEHLNWTRRNNNLWQRNSIGKQTTPGDITTYLGTLRWQSICGWKVKKKFFFETARSITANVNFNNFVLGVLEYDVFLFFPTVFFHAIAVVGAHERKTHEYVQIYANTWTPHEIPIAFPPLFDCIITLRHC